MINRRQSAAPNAVNSRQYKSCDSVMAPGSPLSNTPVCSSTTTSRNTIKFRRLDSNCNEQANKISRTKNALLAASSSSEDPDDRPSSSRNTAENALIVSGA